MQFWCFEGLLDTWTFLLGCFPTDAEPKGPYRVGDILDQLLAQIFEDQTPAVAQMIAYTPRDADFPASDQSLEPGSDIDPVAKDVALLDHDVASINADAKTHGVVRRRRIRLIHGLLDLDGT